MVHTVIPFESWLYQCDIERGIYMSEEKVVAITGGSKGLSASELAQAVQDVAGQDVAEDQIAESLQDAAQEEVTLDANGQKIYGLVQEISDVFKGRIASGEVSPYDVAEALAIALSGTIYSTVPPQKHGLVQREAESLTRKVLKAFDHQVQKKNYMFASQLLGAAKSASYVMSHGNNILKKYQEGQAEAGRKAAEELEKQIKE